MSELPINAVLPELCAALARTPRAVLEAPPGAGKTTRVPLALLDEPWLAGRKIIMLEPRRLAARSAARFMARQLNEEVGHTVGYRIRLESRVSATTRIEVVTEGILTRLLQDDPELAGYGLVIFDEFHERNLHADLGLALSLEIQQALRSELRVLVMSATLDGTRIAQLLHDAPRIISAGRSFPVDVRYVPPSRDTRLENHVASTVRRVLREETGSVLVFLPGAGEIRRTANLLAEHLPADTQLAPLYGDLPGAEQDRAIAPAPAGMRKVVLATAIAETSLTIEGVRVVIDGGLMRTARFDPRAGMTRLVTGRVARANAEQRTGRAGRLEPGMCYRLWPAGEVLAPHAAAEILQADLAPLALELARWGVSDPTNLIWLDAPPSAAYAQARDLLHQLAALDAAGKITAHGRALAELPLHPRLAHMLLAAGPAERGTACDLAALLGERDILRRGAAAPEADLRLRLAALRGLAFGAAEIDSGRARRVRAQADDLRRRQRVDNSPPLLDATGRLLALAYPDRIAQARPGQPGRFLLANGRGAWLSEQDPLAREPWLAVAELDGDAREARIFQSVPLAQTELETLAADLIETREVVDWDASQAAVVARRERRYGALALTQARLAHPDPAAVTAALLDGIRQQGLACLPWGAATRQWQARVLFLRRTLGEGWPDVGDARLLASLEAWLAPYLVGMNRLAHLQTLNLRQALAGLLAYPQQRELDMLAPSQHTVPSGSRVNLDYAQDPPVLAVRLQELFGCTDTPRLAGGRVAVMLHLLSPARRPVQVTRDLAGFWRGAYHEVKKELRGRYPKHHWPDDPLTAAPTARAKPRKA